MWDGPRQFRLVMAVLRSFPFLTGHRELQVVVPDTCQEYQFDEVMVPVLSITQQQELVNTKMLFVCRVSSPLSVSTMRPQDTQEVHLAFSMVSPMKRSFGQEKLTTHW